MVENMSAGLVDRLELSRVCFVLVLFSFRFIFRHSLLTSQLPTSLAFDVLVVRIAAAPSVQVLGCGAGGFMVQLGRAW